MGIPKFYGTFLAKIPGVKATTLKDKVRGISFDVNGILHGIAQKVFDYGGNRREYTAFLASRLDETTLMQNFLDELIKKIEEHIAETKPTEYISVCIDGLAPYAKINQQRARRLQKSEGNPPAVFKNGWSFNPHSITAGTTFMETVSNHLEQWCENCTMEVFFSGHRTPGEGEHKMMHFIRSLPHGTGSHVVVGDDGDFAMLAILIPTTGMTIKRYNGWEKRYEYVLVDEFKKYLRKHMKDSYESYVVVSCLMGNDFVPGMRSLGPSNRGFVDFYASVFPLMTETLCKNGTINWTVFKKIIDHLASTEMAAFREQATVVSQDYRILSDHVQLEPAQDAQLYSPVKKFDTKAFRIAWNKRLVYGGSTFTSIGEADPSKACQEYLSQIQWVIRYYRNDPISMHQWYRFLFPPLFTDLSKYLEKYPDGPPPPVYYEGKMSLLTKLLSVLPPSSRDLLPLEYQDLLLPTGILFDLCPIKFRREADGKVEKYLHTEVIPSPDLKRVVRVVKSYGGELPEYMTSKPAYHRKVTVVRVKESVDLSFLLW